MNCQHSRVDDANTNEISQQTLKINKKVNINFFNRFKEQRS